MIAELPQPPAKRPTDRKPSRPFVTANFAISADGKITSGTKHGGNFSSPRDKRRLLQIRANCDAVLVGARTLSADTMTLGIPPALRAARKKRGLPAWPLRIIVARSNLPPANAKAFAKNLPRALVWTTFQSDPHKVLDLFHVADVNVQLAHEVNLPRMLETLRKQHHVKRLVCEGGGTLFRALLELGLVDELHLTICPHIFPGTKTTTLTGRVASFLPTATKLQLIEMIPAGDECFTRWKVLREK